ncbi:hypothetical protein [Synoicihabitans lomoniglobus]|uniref:Glycosyltransferase RgtA/B/C/D-like domain-containing protein n=1 Tax=Synoicihabitans lomoniglobus TaxID=2909285 RepID=A0AAE9ZUC7_9BACT|nr:glycosyltransferase family 39 protein [Opitutaceae bacterium LMO-M01]WED63194.1 hypothetical protein PXH66_12730 [Opitutaceae bacterium LMO-M01]
MSVQNWIHWLEQGRGTAALKGVVVVLGLLALSFTVAFKQFHGPRTEETLRQADLGRSLATGAGFTTSINYPQAHAVMERHGRLFETDRRLPELYQAPGYALVLGAAMAVLPESMRAGLFADAPNPPDGFGADYLLLVINVVLLWIAAVQTWRLGTRLFDATVGTVAGLALLISTPVWAHVVAVDGTALAMVLLLGLFQGLAAADQAMDDDRRRRALAAWGVAGLMAGLLFLTDYPLGLLVLVVAGHAWWRRVPAAAGIALGLAVLVALPWVWRNIELTGSPVALAAQDVALRSGDPTADPAVWRTTLSAESPAINLNKVGSKTLAAVQHTLRDRLWSDGGLVLTAFFVTGWIYRFRRKSSNRLRTVFALALGVMVVAQGMLNSGEGERGSTAIAAPLIILFGAGFFMVLVASSDVLKRAPRWAACGLLAVQALPLMHDLAEPRRIHFSYPPYYPSFFINLGHEVTRRGDPVAGWMADVPAGAAWYSGQRVWAQPHTLRDFYAVNVDQHLLALVLTPETLDRPFFSELLGGEVSTTRFGEWGKVYTGLISGRLPRDFPLRESRSLAQNFQLLLDPAWVRPRGK